MKTKATALRTLSTALLALLLVLAAFTFQGLRQTQANNAASEDLNHYVSALNSNDAAVRAAAVKEAHAERDVAAAALLFEHIDDPDPAVGLYVAQALGDLAPADLLPELRAALNDPNADVRYRAALALGQLEDAGATSGLVELVDDPEVLVVSEAATALAKVGTSDALRALVGQLAEADPAALHAAKRALLDAGDEAVPALVAALDGSDATVRAEAAGLLGYIDSGAALPALQAALSDADAGVRAEAGWAIAEISR
jgi:HEAT repeat protein